jgi:hypothetical protein
MKRPGLRAGVSSKGKLGGWDRIPGAQEGKPSGWGVDFMRNGSPNSRNYQEEYYINWVSDFERELRHYL